VTQQMPAMGDADMITAATHTVFGTPAYMAPEVLFGEPSTAASDIYSLGVVVFECITGRRPHDATTLVEMIAQVIESPPPRLDHPLGELVERMLTREPPERPSIDDIARRLAPRRTRPVALAVPRPPRPWATIILAAIATVSVVAAVFFAWQANTASAPAMAPTPPTASIAVAPFTIDIPSYGREAPVPGAFADTLAQLLGQIEGGRITAVPVATTDLASPRSMNIDLLVRGKIREHDGKLRAELELVSTHTERPTATVASEAPLNHPAQLLEAVARTLARDAMPSADVALGDGQTRAQLFLRKGVQLLEAGKFTDARPFLEQAVQADPDLGEAWYQLVMAFAWTDAVEELELAATAKAIELAAPGPKKVLLLAIQLYLKQDWTEMRKQLETIEHATGRDTPAPRELLYYLGEANWHDGYHAKAFDYFKRSLDADPHFRPSTVHAWQYLVARRDPAAARYLALADARPEWLDFALGKYDELAPNVYPPFRLWATLVLDRAPSADEEAWIAGDAIPNRVLRIARALGRGDDAVARSELAALWRAKLEGRDPATLPLVTFTELEDLGEVLAAAELGPELKRLVTLFESQKRPRNTRGYQRLAILAAPIVHDAAIIDRDHPSSRNRRMIEAVEAELAGKTAQAAAIFGELVANPTFTWDYPERVALVRELVALGKKGARELAALCADTTSRPAVFRASYLVVRHRCAIAKPAHVR